MHYRRFTPIHLLAYLLMVFGCATNAPLEKYHFEVTFPSGLSEEPITGRLLLMLSTKDGEEPRFQIKDGLDAQLIFGIDVEDWQPGETISIGADAFGFPLISTNEIAEGNYTIQALVNKY